MLRSEIYIGNVVQGKFGTISYKNPKLVNKSKDQWVRVENTHEPLIDIQTWEAVRSLDEKKYSPRKISDENTSNMFSGLLKCADCGFTMRMSVEKGLHKNGSNYQYVSYFCGNYSRSVKSACTAHIIYKSALSQLILDDIRRNAKSVVYDEQRVIKNIMNAKNQENRSALSAYKHGLKSSETRILELDRIIKTLYEDRVNGIITDIMFKNLVSKYETEREEKEKSVKVLRKKIEKCESDNVNTNSWIETIRKYTELEALSPDILIELIDKIKVFEAEKINGRRICRVKIFYRFVGNVSKAGDICEQAV